MALSQAEDLGLLCGDEDLGFGFRGLCIHSVSAPPPLNSNLQETDSSRLGFGIKCLDWNAYVPGFGALGTLSSGSGFAV